MRNVARTLHFPFAGVSRSLAVRDNTQPSETRVYATPLAMNVRGSCTFADRRRGGSRPSFNPPAIDASAIPEAYYRARRFYADGAMWYASRTSDYEDFNVGGDGGDATRPVAGSVKLPFRPADDNITALFAPDNGAIYLTTADTLWMLAGEPTGGTFRLVSPNVGCVSPQAWAWDGVRYYVLSSKGLYSFAAGEPPIRISDEIPADLRGATAAALAYDAEDRILHVVTDNCGSWTYELDDKAWWPFDVSTNASYVAIGPFRTSGRDDEDGILDTIHAAMAAGSSTVTLEVYRAKTAEEVLTAAKGGNPVFTASLSAGFNHTIRPRVRGAWCIVMLRSGGAWAYETMTATYKQLGRLR